MLLPSPAVAALLAVLFAWPLSAQAKPDFSGAWTLVSAVPAVPAGPLGRGGTVTQDASSLTFTTGSRSVTYRLDRPETQTPTTTVRGETWLLTSQVRWVQDALLVVTKTTAPIGTWEDMLTCALDGQGNLTIVALATPKSGESAMITTLMTYRRN
jgi:hypothetical protein